MQAVFAHLVVDLFVAQVGFDADARRFELRRGVLRIIVGIGHNRRDDRLHRREPSGEAAREMLDQYADEAFIGAEDRAVEHHRAVALAILAHVGCIEAFGHDAVGLDRAALPRPADRVGQVEFELWCIEGAFARQFLPAIIVVRHARARDRLTQFLLGLVPHRVGAEAHLGPQRELHGIFLEAELLVDAVEQFAEGAHFLDDLILAAENMAVVLRELADTHDAVQRTMRFVAVAAAHFGHAQRQVAVRLDPLAEDQHVRGAIHRLERHPLGIVGDERAVVLDIRHLVGDDEHILAIFAPVARLFPLARVHHLRRLDLLIARAVDRPAHIGLELAIDAIALGVPEDAAVRLFLEVEEVHLAADLAMVALRGLLQPDEMLGELLLVEPAGAIDTRKLRILLVAAPIGARDARQLEGGGVELARRGQVGAAAHVHPAVSRAIDGQFLALGQFGGPFGLERLTLGLPFGDQLVAFPHLARQRQVGGDDTAHLLFDQRQLVVAERAAVGGRREIIIETVVRRGTEGDLRAGKQSLHCLRQHMRIVVANEFERIGLVAARDQRKVGVFLQRPHDVAQFAVDLGGKCRLGEAGADVCRDLRRSSAACDFSGRAVGKGDADHLGHWKSGLSGGINCAPLPARESSGKGRFHREGLQ